MVTWHGVTWRGVTWHGVTWRGVTWRGVTWHGVTHFMKTGKIFLNHVRFSRKRLVSAMHPGYLPRVAKGSVGEQASARVAKRSVREEGIATCRQGKCR